jgi:hypothetical protein
MKGNKGEGKRRRKESKESRNKGGIKGWVNKKK